MSEADIINKAVVWWEKTVEYKFICDCLEKGIIKTISPLAGNEERVGDAISILENSLKQHKFYIIEFKRELNEVEFEKELKKFPQQLKGYESAQRCFNSKAANKLKKAHYFIAAKYEGGRFELFSREYFASNKNITNTLEEAFSSETGLTQEEFKEYVLCFTTHKQKNTCYKCPNRNEGGSANPDPDGDFSPTGGGDGVIIDKEEEKILTMVVAINPETKDCTAFPLEWIRVTGKKGGESKVMNPTISGGPRSPSGGEVFVKNEIIITQYKYSDSFPADLSPPEDLKEEIIG
ncbi:hypothetical protein [Leclercia sp. W17]|uniref:hypothetical protein n=1 Tax=Leclercia sp. W17 TaxID=2282309 RepID=UPI000DF2309D|nr:hypothetical protein [Leclercia sp. W17]AXF65218.1 hypothetical protein DVA44_14465 [Leclercia sp. W17]